MRRQKPAFAVPPRLLRRFAAATVVLTLLLAFFVSSSDSESLAQQMQDRAERNRIAAANPGEPGTHDMIVKGKRSSSDEYRSADEGPDNPVADSGSSTLPDQVAAVPPPFASAERGGLGALPPSLAETVGAGKASGTTSRPRKSQRAGPTAADLRALSALGNDGAASAPQS